MMRVIVNPAVLPPDALSELKDWLGIASGVNDAALAALLATATDICADFIGLVPIACGCEEMLALPAVTGRAPLPPGVPALAEWPWGAAPWARDGRAAPGWQALVTRPVLAVSGVAGVAVDGTRTALAAGTFAVRIDAEGGCAVRVQGDAGFGRCVVSFTAGLAPTWDALPGPIRQGIVCLAGNLFQSSASVASGTVPPASVTALWMPWRRVRLA